MKERKFLCFGEGKAMLRAVVVRGSMVPGFLIILGSGNFSLVEERSHSFFRYAIGLWKQNNWAFGLQIGSCIPTQ